MFALLADRSSRVNVQLSLAHAEPSASIRLRVEHIPDTVATPLAQVEFVEEFTLALIDGAGTAMLPPLPLGDAFRVTLLPAGGQKRNWR